MNTQQERNLQFLYEIGTLRYVPRTWRQFLNKDFANLSEHIFRMMWIAVILAEAEGADIGKVVKMALVHDIAESRAGDVHYLSRMYVQRDEEKALQDMFDDVSVADEFLALAEEYEQRETLEAKIVKDADNLDVDMELQEQAANGVKVGEDFDVMRQQVLKKLFTKTAKQMMQAIWESNPHDWHVTGSNRFTEGDWQRQDRQDP